MKWSFLFTFLSTLHDNAILLECYTFVWLHPLLWCSAIVTLDDHLPMWRRAFSVLVRGSLGTGIVQPSIVPIVIISKQRFIFQKQWWYQSSWKSFYLVLDTISRKIESLKKFIISLLSIRQVYSLKKCARLS